jgi:hypothetical protein
MVKFPVPQQQSPCHIARKRRLRLTRFRDRRAGGCLLLLRNAALRKIVSTLVFCVALVAAYPMPAYLMPPARFVEPLPQICILDRLFLRGLPAVGLPAADPFSDAVSQILRVCMDLNAAWPFERL